MRISKPRVVRLLIFELVSIVLSLVVIAVVMIGVATMVGAIHACDTCNTRLGGKRG